MRKSLFLIFVALSSTAFTVFSLTGPGLSDYIWISLPCAIASVLLIALQRFVRRRSTPDKSQKVAIVDGSNIMYWLDGKPSFKPLNDVIDSLKLRGYQPGVMFDANAGYRLAGRYMDDRAMAAILCLPTEAVLVVAKGQPADEVILNAARKLDAIVVTNDRYRDWADDFPEVMDSGFLVRGKYRSTGVWLNLGAE